MNQSIDSCQSGIDPFPENTFYIPPIPAFVSSQTEFKTKGMGGIDINTTEWLTAATKMSQLRTSNLARVPNEVNCRFINLRCGKKWSQSSRNVASIDIGSNTSQPVIEVDHYLVAHPSSTSLDGIPRTIPASFQQTQRHGVSEYPVVSDISEAISEEFKKRSISQVQALERRRQCVPNESPYQNRVLGTAPSKEFKKPMSESDDYEIVPLADGAYKRRRNGRLRWQYCCHHGRVRCVCKQCGGTSICLHNRERSKCRDCGGASICSHHRVRSQCKYCRSIFSQREKCVKEHIQTHQQ